MILFLGLNFVCAVIYAVIKRLSHEPAGVALFFIFLPWLGFVIYFVPRILQKLLFEGSYDRDSLVRRQKIGRMAEHPDVQSELNVVPVEDAMAVGENAEKRNLLLKQLKKDINENYKVLLAAENDSDSESVHYVAAAKMEVYRVQQKKWIESYRRYQEDSKNEEKYRAACTALCGLIEGQILSAQEENMYKKKYCQMIREQEWISGDMVSKEDYEKYLIYLVELGQNSEAEAFWKQKREMVRCEACYMKMIELFYREREYLKFKECLNELRGDGQVLLSAEGLSRLRYWMQKE